MPDGTPENPATTITVTRFDTASVELGAFEKTPEGYVRTMGRAAKPGILVYTDTNGRTIRELVPRSVLSDPEYLKSLEYKPVTIAHPKTATGLLDLDTTADLRKGMTLAPVTFDGDYQMIPFQFDTREALDALKSGKYKLSTGCKAVVSMVPGVDDEFGAYDAIQMRRHSGNHVALCDDPRSGDDDLCVLRFDSAGNQIDPLSSTEPPLTLSPIAKQILEALGLDAAKAATDADALAMVAAMKGATSEVQKKLDEVSPKVADLQAQLIQVSADKARIEGELAAAVEEGEMMASPSDPAAIVALADDGPMMDAAMMDSVKMDSARAEKIKSGRKASWDALNRAMNRRFPLLLQAEAAGVVRTDSAELGNKALVKAIAEKRLPAEVLAAHGTDYAYLEGRLAGEMVRTDSSGSSLDFWRNKETDAVRNDSAAPSHVAHYRFPLN